MVTIFFSEYVKTKIYEKLLKKTLFIEELKLLKKNNYLHLIHLFLLAFWEVTEFEIVPVPVASLETFLLVGDLSRVKQTLSIFCGFPLIQIIQRPWLPGKFSWHLAI